MSRLPLPRLALTLTWGFTLIFIALCVVGANLLRSQNTNEGAASAMGYAKLVAEHVAGKLYASRLVLASLSSDLLEKNLVREPLAVGPNAKAHADALDEVRLRLGQAPVTQAVILANRQGKVQQSSPANFAMDSLPEELLSRALTTGAQSVVLSDTFRLNEKQVIVVAMPVIDGSGEVAGIVGLVVDLDLFFNRFYREVSLPKNSIVAVFDLDNRLLAGIPIPDSMMGQYPPTQKLLAMMREKGGEKTLFAQSAFDERQRVYAVVDVRNYAVKVMVSLDEAYYLGPYHLFLRLAMLGALVLAIFSAVVSYLAVRRKQVQADADALIKSAQDSLMAHVAILDRDGTIVSVNDGWRKFAEQNALELGLLPPNTSVGTNYLKVCSGASGACSDEAGEVWRGIKAVLEGREETFQLVYPCHAPKEKRWFQLMVSPLRTSGGGAVVSHTNVTRLILAEQAVKESEQHFRTLANSGSALIWTSNSAGEATYFNEAWLRFTGRSLEAQLGLGWQSAIHPEDIEERESVYRHALAERQRFSLDYRLLHADGSYHWVQDDGAPRFDSQGNFIGLIGFCLDISERKRSENDLRTLNQAIQQSPDSVVITDCDGRIEFVNDAFTEITGYSREDALGKTPRILRSNRTAQSTYRSMWDALQQGEVWRGELVNRRKDATEYIQNITIGPVRDDKGRINRFIAIQRDISEQRKKEEVIERLSYYDGLTGLVNRRLMLERIGHAIKSFLANQAISALLVVDIDRFKTFNEARGHESGDQLLIAIARRFARTFRGSEVLARMSADEFALLLMEGAVDREMAAKRAMHAADQIHAALQSPLEVDGESIIVTASIGITLIPEIRDDTPQEILIRVDTALHRAKDAGGNQSAFFEPKMGSMVQQRFQIERDLRQGIQMGELKLYLQPQVDAQGVMVGSEALVRWQHPERGLVAPGLFIPIAEESDLIVDLDSWVLDELCRLLTNPVLAAQTMRISVNISPRHFRQSNFVASIKQLLNNYGTDPCKLTFEITEGLVIDNIHEVIAKMHDLASLGIHFSLDDFGTGYSSLAYLKRLPINELKIDKSFVQDAPEDPNDGALVETILSVASHLSLKVVAEGVETQAQADFLNRRAKVIHQGFLYGRPEPADVWLARLTAAKAAD